MPTITRSIEGFRVSSRGTGDWTSIGSKEWVLDLEEIMDGSTINSATLNISVNGYGDSLLYLNENQTTRKNITNVNNAAYDVTSMFAGKTVFSSDDTFKFTFQTYDITYGETYTCRYNGAVGSDVVLTIDYTLPYSACTPPTSVSAASTNVAPGATVRVSWSGAEDGRNNPIASYTVYRSEDGTNWSELQTGVSAENAYLDVTAPTVNGASYLYAVQSIGTQSGYSSARSQAYATVTCAYSDPSVSGIMIDSSSATVYKLVGSTAVLSWTGVAGTNNPIVKYVITRNGAAFTEVSEGTSLTIDAPAAGGNYYYGITPVGTYSNGEAVTSPTIYAYSNPTAPTSLTLDKTVAGKSEEVRLSWSGASSGSLNAITGYKVYRATSLNGNYAYLATVNVVAPVVSYIVTSSASNGAYYYYKVSTIGAHSESEKSTEYARLRTSWAVPYASRLSVTPDVVAPGGTSLFSWDIFGETNNPVTAIEVYGGTTGNTLLDTLGPSARSYTVTASATAGSFVILRIKPLGTVEDGVKSDTYAKLYSYGPVTPPTSVSIDNAVVDAGTNAVLSWSGAGDGSYNTVVGYEVWRSTSASGTYTLLQDGITGTSLSVTAPSQMGSSYYYKVKAVGEYTTSDMSSASASLTARVYTAPGAPVATMTPAEAGVGDSPVLSWTAAADGTNNPVTGYKVFRSSDGTTFAQLGNDLPANTLSLSVEKPATMGAYYYYRVYATAARAGYTLSPASNTVSLRNKVYTKCGAPTNVQISATLANPNTVVTVSWAAGSAGTNNPIAGYTVYRNTGSGFAVFSNVESAVLSVTDTVGASGTTYSYKIVTVGEISGFDSDASSTVSVKSNSPPNAVTQFGQIPEYYESGPLTITWTKPADADSNVSSYNVQWRVRTDEGSSAEWGAWADLPNTNTNQFTYTPVVERGYQFQFRVQTVDSLGLTSGWAETSVINRNRAPYFPALLSPPENAITYDVQPFLLLRLSADPDGHTVYVDMAIDNDEFRQVPTTYAVRNVSVRCYRSLSIGDTHVVYVRTRDSLGAVSEARSVHIKVMSIEWARAIARGVVISKAGSEFINETLVLLDGEFTDDTVTVNNGSWDDTTLIVDDSGGISHQAEVLQMYEYVNSGLTYYIIDPLEVPDLVGQNYENMGDGKIGMFASWGDQMLELYNAMVSIYRRLGRQAPSVAITSGMIPSAAVINTIRAMIENM